MSLAEQIYIESASLPEKAAAEVLDFVRFLKTRHVSLASTPTRSIEFSEFDAVPNTFDGPLDRDELYDRDVLR